MPSNILHRWHTLAALSAALVLFGCEGQGPPPIDVRAIGEVQAEIKRQVAIYMRAAENAPVYVTINGVKTDIHYQADTPSQRNLFWCGSGNINFDISSIKAELTTALDLTAGFNFTLTPPVPVVPVSGTFSFSRATHNTQTLDYNLWPLEMKRQSDEFRAVGPPTEKDLGTAEIAQVLLNLRQALITGATRIDYLTGKERWPQPCFTDYDPNKPASDAGNSYTIGLAITTSANGTVSVGVSALKAGVSAGSTTATGHSLKVMFVQRDLGPLQTAKNRVDFYCKTPNEGSKECRDAIAAYNKVRDTTGTGVNIFVEQQ
jgi:hypothetical protein